MIKVKCAYCGSIFQAPTVRRIYCSDSCRRKAFRAKNSKDKPKVKRLQSDRKIDDRFVSSDDPAWKLIEALEKYGKFSYEYWQAFRDYELTYTNGSSKMSVNGFSVKDDDFPEIMTAVYADVYIAEIVSDE